MTVATPSKPEINDIDLLVDRAASFLKNTLCMHVEDELLELIQCWDAEDEFALSQEDAQQLTDYLLETLDVTVKPVSK